MLGDFQTTEYDIIIIGAGAAGLTAGLYAIRSGMKVKLLDRTVPGGQLLVTETIENFPGFADGIKGPQLAERLKKQAVDAGLEIVTDEVKQLVRVQPTEVVGWYNVKVSEEKHYTTHSVILACGAHPRRLNVPREEMLTGKGVSYCATCDGPLFRDKEVIVVGGGNAAVEEALFLANIVSKVTIVHRRDILRADKVYQDKIKANPKVDFVWNAQVLEILGEQKARGVKIKDTVTGNTREIESDAVFIFAGLKPNTGFVKGFLKMDTQGFIVTNEYLETTQTGVFACGDCRLKSLYQVITACGEGAQAAHLARSYVEELKGTSYDATKKKTPPA